MALSLTHELPVPIRKARYSAQLEWRDTAGALTTPTSPDTEYSLNGGATWTDCAEEVAPTDGAGYMTLTGAEMDGNSVRVQSKGGGVLTATVFITPHDLPILRSATAQAGGATTITLDASASAVDDYYNGCIIRTTGGTGGGGTGGANNQARVITDYIGSTKVATVTAWETQPSSDTTFDILVPIGWHQAPGVRALLALPAVAPDSSGGLATEDANGNLAADLAYVHGSALTEAGGAGRLAAAISTFGDVATPLFTAASAMRGTDGAALASDWTSGRAAFLDQLDGATDGTLCEVVKTCLTELSNRANNSSLHDLLGIPDEAAHTLLTEIAAGNVAGVAGSVTGSVGSVAGNVTGSVGSVAGNVTGSVASVVGAVGSIGTGGVAATSFAAGAITAAAIAADAIDAAALSSDAVTEIAAGILATSLGYNGATQRTVAQALKELWSGVVGEVTYTTVTGIFQEPDGTTTEFTHTLDSATTPTLRTLTLP